MSGVKHALVSAVVDDGVPGEVGPSDWNAGHVLDELSNFATLTSDGATAVVGSIFNFDRAGITTVGIASALYSYAGKSDGAGSSIPAGILGQVKVTGGTLNHAVGVLGWADVRSEE